MGEQEATAPVGTASADEAGAALGVELSRLSRLIGAWRQRQRSAPGGGEQLLLARLVTCGPRRATDLAADVLLDLSTVSRQVRSLIDQGLVERWPDPEDRRGAVLEATDAGRAAFERYRQERDNKLATLLRDWPPEDRCQLVRLMRRLGDELTERHAQASRSALLTVLGESRAASGQGTGAAQ